MVPGFRLFAIELYEYVVPDLDHLRMVFIDQVATRDLRAFGIRSTVDVDLAAGTTGTGITHLPEIIFLISVNDLLFGQQFFPFG